MPLHWMDGFDNYGGDDITELYNTLYGGSTPPTIGAFGRRGTNGIRFLGGYGYGNANAVGLTLQPGGLTMYAGFAFRGTNLSGGGFNWSYMDVVPTGSINPKSGSADRNNWMFMVRGGGVSHTAFRINKNGTISACYGDGPDADPDADFAVSGTTTNALQAGVYYFIELKILIAQSTGTILMKVNGDTWLNLSSVNTRNNVNSSFWDYVPPFLWDEIVFGKLQTDSPTGGPNGAWDYDDLYVGDTSAGSSTNDLNDLAGDVRIDWKKPTADGVNTGFTPFPASPTTHYDKVDDTTPDDDITYNEATTAALKDTFVMEDASVPTENVLAMMLRWSSKRVASGSSSVNGVVRHSGTDYDGSAIGDSSSYAFRHNIFTKKPNDFSVISAADFNAFELGYKKAS